MVHMEEDTVNNLSAIHQFFSAVSGLQYPKLHLRASDGTVVVLKRNGSRSRWMGQIAVSNDAPYGSVQSRYFGRIDNTGRFVESNHSNAVVALLTALATNPADTIANHGHLTSSCACCQLPLSDDRSLQVGYGPVCAKNWHLPWGTKAPKTVVETAASAIGQHVEEDVDAYAALLSREDLRTSMLTRLGQCIMADMRMDVLKADLAQVAAMNERDAELDAIHPESLAEAQARTLATVDAPAIPEETRTMPVPLTSVRVAAVAMPALNITVPTAEVAQQAAPVVTDVKVLNLDLLREELRKVRQQYRRPQA